MRASCSSLARPTAAVPARPAEPDRPVGRPARIRATVPPSRRSGETPCCAHSVCTNRRASGAVARRGARAARDARRDFPMPGSPQRWITWPSPRTALSHPSKSNRHSRSRPDERHESACARALPVDCAPRSAAVHGAPRSAAGTPFIARVPASSTTNQPATKRCVAALIITSPGFAAACTRAAMFGVSPRTTVSRRPPAPTVRITHGPLCSPTRTDRPRPRSATTRTISNPARTACSAESSCASG